MKMPEKYDLLGCHSRGKGTRHRGQSLRLHGVLAADIMAVRLQNSNRRNDAPMQFIRDLLTLPDFTVISSLI